MPIQIVNYDGGGGSSGVAGVGAAFVNGDLVGGVYTFAHALGIQYPSIAVYDESDLEITPDDITAVNTNTSSIDISSYGAISGTWNVRGVG